MKDYIPKEKPEPAEMVWGERARHIVAQASAPAGSGSVPLPVYACATSRGGTPLKPAAGTAALPALPGAPKVRPISDHGNGNEIIGKRHADQLAVNQLQSLLIPAEFAETKTAAGRRRMWRTRQAHSSHRPSPAGGGIVVEANGKEAPCRSSAAVPGCECGWLLAASSIAGRDARPTRRRDASATRFTQAHAAPTALGRIELKTPIKFSTRFGNGRKP